MSQNQQKRQKPRDQWITNTWRYNGAGYQKNKKKVIERKQKHKERYRDGIF